MRGRSRLEPILLPILAASTLLAVWHLSVVLTRTEVFPGPKVVFKVIFELVRDRQLAKHVGSSISRVIAGFVLATAVGLPAGMALGWYRNAKAAINPIVQFLRPISPLAWTPLAIILFGVADASAVFLIFMSCVCPIIVASMNAVESVSQIHLRVGRNFGLSTGQIFRRILLPAIAPQVLTSLRLALGIGWLVIVAAEMIAVNSGLGFMIVDARNAGKRYDLVVASMLIVGILGLVLDACCRSLERLRSVRWGFRDR